MNITDPFVLPEDVQLVPCAELSADVRERITFDEGDFTLSRRRSRALAQVIDGETAALLALFRTPRTIVDAVVETSRASGRDPEMWLDELLPHLGKFLHNGVLVPADSEQKEEIRPSFESGAAFGGWTVVRCANLIDDSEIYQLRKENRTAALKLARTENLRALFENEIAVLRHLDGSGIAPRLLETGEHEGKPYFICDWVDGVEADVAAAQRRHDRASLIELCASIASAYATLHARGVLHADVHPRNVFAGRDVMLLDFGFSHITGMPPRVGRGGMYTFFEPEYLAALRQGRMLPPTPAGEQYSIAALLYMLIARTPYLDFRLEREEMVRQAEKEPPVPFAKRNIPPWPEVEQILFRALDKDPAQRFASMEEMAARLAEAREASVRKSLATPVSAEAHALLAETLQSFARGGAMFATGYQCAPTASVYAGAAGAAVALLRIAETRSDPELLALAGVWRSRALALLGTDDAFYSDELELPRSLLGDVTPCHTESGVFAATALLAASMGDTHTQRRAVSAFVRASSLNCADLDLTLGRSATLHAAAMLLDEELPELRAFGTRTMHEIWTELDGHGPLAETTSHLSLGLAHGWAGYLYAAMRWCLASGDPLPPRVAERLDELAALKTNKGRGAYWRLPTFPGWCTGSAGHVFLFTLAHRLFGDERWLQLAELAGWHTWDEPRLAFDFCCGTAGRAYALLNLYKHTGATEWLSRARQLANDAAAHAQGPPSLWKGTLGVAVLIADLASPENARMPFFE